MLFFSSIFELIFVNMAICGNKKDFYQIQLVHIYFEDILNFESSLNHSILKFVKMRNRVKSFSPPVSVVRKRVSWKFLAWFRTLRIFPKMFKNTEIAQNLSEYLIRSPQQSEKKTFRSQEKKTHSVFSGPHWYFSTYKNY